MAKFEYKKIQTVLGNNWHVVVDGDWLFYPCGEDLGEVKAFAETYKENLGLAFYICGYNGDAQNRLRGKWAERGVHVF